MKVKQGYATIARIRVSGLREAGATNEDATGCLNIPDDRQELIDDLDIGRSTVILSLNECQIDIFPVIPSDRHVYLALLLAVLAVDEIVAPHIRAWLELGKDLLG
jgi:hypothetical protein